MANIPVFGKSIRTAHGTEISTDQALTYAILRSILKAIGILLGLLHILRAYCLRCGAGNAFNRICSSSIHSSSVVRYANSSGIDDVSNPLQNMMMQHADMRTFLNHYLSRRVMADTAAIVRALNPEDKSMRAACRLGRWINPDRPQELTMRRPFPSTRNLAFTNLSPKYPVQEIEKQLSGRKFTEGVKSALESSDDMPPAQRRLVETVMSLPGATLEEEFLRRNTAIDAVAAYCKFEKGGLRRGGKSARMVVSLPSPDTGSQVIAAMAEEQALKAAMISTFTERRPCGCFYCLGRECLSFEKRVYSFKTRGDLTQHFKRKHLSHINEGERPQCNACKIQLKNKMHFQNHALAIPVTVS
ncbi:hypothetical protein BJ878DRAFT_577054 [Calycina marina]|uniref:C2H2-type domain-containing protein n=1 Tax=Calycina marina TaxID=1763456 RepID=A0A9P8CDB0_9HELO|nr:hypothetical protein BJ878DRAFT_577054 [Calycina marina]